MRYEGQHWTLLIPLRKKPVLFQEGTNISDDVDFSTVNLFPHSLFSQIDFEIDGINLCSNDNLYPYKAYLETLLTYGHDAKNSHLSTSHFVKDSAHHFESGSQGNNGYITRQKRCGWEQIA